MLVLIVTGPRGCGITGRLVFHRQALRGRCHVIDEATAEDAVKYWRLCSTATLLLGMSDAEYNKFTAPTFPPYVTIKTEHLHVL
jgi:hypothetical protein